MIDDIPLTIARLRRETRDTLGWTPHFTVTQFGPNGPRDVTAWYPA